MKTELLLDSKRPKSSRMNLIPDTESLDTLKCHSPLIVRMVARAALLAKILYWRERCRAWLARRASADRSIFLPHPVLSCQESGRRAVNSILRWRTLFLVNLRVSYIVSKLRSYVVVMFNYQTTKLRNYLKSMRSFPEKLSVASLGVKRAGGIIPPLNGNRPGVRPEAKSSDPVLSKKTGSVSKSTG